MTNSRTVVRRGAENFPADPKPSLPCRQGNYSRLRKDLDSMMCLASAGRLLLPRRRARSTAASLALAASVRWEHCQSAKSGSRPVAGRPPTDRATVRERPWPARLKPGNARTKPHRGQRAPAWRITRRYTMREARAGPYTVRRRDQPTDFGIRCEKFHLGNLPNDSATGGRNDKGEFNRSAIPIRRLLAADRHPGCYYPAANRHCHRQQSAVDFGSPA